ncbi:MAG: FG-GAP-like repeat-containing protein [Anaerolineae bacterium]
MFQKALLKTTRARRFRSGMIALCAIGAILLATLGPLPLLANPGTVTVRVDPATRAAPVNGTFTVDIVADVGAEMDPTGGLGAYEFDLVYDPNYLEVDSVGDAAGLGATNRTVSELGPNIDNPNGRMTFAAYSYPPLDVNGPGSTVVLATVTLRAKQAGVTTLNLGNALLTDTQANAWPDAGEGRELNVVGGTVTVAVPADFDGDAKTDMGVYGPTGDWYVLTSSSGFDVASHIYRLWGATGYDPVLGDYDGDGKTDMGVYGPTGDWYALTSSSGFDVASHIFRQWGATGYDPVLGDYDGDGKTDMGVYGTNNGQWWVLTSSSGFDVASHIFRQWGATDYEPVLGDYDGDGKTDIAVYGTTNGRWYVLTSSSGFDVASHIFRQWGATGYNDLP